MNDKLTDIFNEIRASSESTLVSAHFIMQMPGAVKRRAGYYAFPICCG